MKKLLRKLSGLDRRSKGDPGEAKMESVDEEDLDYLEAAITDDREAEENEENLSEDEEEPEEGGEDDSSVNSKQDEEQWLPEDYEEGQLSIDVYQTPKEIVVKSTIAGVKPEDIDISINNDMLTIRGKREMQEEVREDHYLYRECYWGSFSRSIILPVEVEADKIEAFLENGVLTVSLPKAKTAQQISIKVKER